MRYTLICFYIFAFGLALHAQNTTINYTGSNVDMPNPERGFYLPSQLTRASNYTFLDSAYLASKRNPFTPYNANYQVHTTLIFRYFVLDDFVDASITQDFLDNMQTDFDAARTAGVKLIVRFSYTNSPSSGSCGDICPPYGDASKARILEHINDLKDVLETNKDIIATVQMGFIGIWGENYYTDFFGDASMSPFIITNNNWIDRNEVLEALLDAVPIERAVQVRYPQLKQRYVYGLGAPTNSPALTSTEAFTQSDKARLGFHNDCFLASDTDFGTFADYGPPVSLSDTVNLKPYWENDSQFVPVGGETCFVNNSDDNCAAVGGRADAEMDRLNYSFLNSEFNNNVNNDWVGICLDDIKKKLGYRFALISGTFPNTVDAGDNLSILINLENQGYTSPYNPRGLELVLRNTASGDTFFAPLVTDPRFFSTGLHQISETICLPANVPSGNYELLLNLPDPEPTIFNNPDYSIQLANQNVWESATGFNKLNHTIQINPSTFTTVCSTGQLLTSISIYDPTYCDSVLNLSNNITTDVYQAEDKIISDGVINSTEFPIYQAGNSIELNNGFEVKNGAIFLAVIEACFE